jgi:hypothetical protein
MEKVMLSYRNLLALGKLGIALLPLFAFLNDLCKKLSV